MFANQNQLAREVQWISRIDVSVGGNPANDHDRRQFQSVTLLRYALEADLLGLSKPQQCVYRRVIHGLTSVDLANYAQDCKTVKLCFIALWQEHQELTWQYFKRIVSGKIQYKWILVLPEKLWDDPSAILQWLSFDERMLLTTNEDDIDDDIASYIAFEQDLRQRSYPEDLCNDLADIISEWLKDFSLSDTKPRPKFGPGVVADLEGGRLSPLMKAHIMTYDPSVVSQLCETFYCDEDELIVGKPDNRASYTNRIIFRPKNALKRRIISAEPCWLSWLQQAIKNPLYDYVEGHPRMFTWFSNQVASRDMALQGSRDGSHATFDYSNASDSVTVTMVDSLFSKTYIHDALLLTRSTCAELPDGQIISLEKFAPMGSATCFVTMDIIILSICEFSIRKALGRPGKVGDYVVYGDDAIIRQEAADLFLSASKTLGLSINTDKSYWKPDQPHHYRESCGIEALDGVDITPLRYSRFQEPLIGMSPTQKGEISTELHSAISLVNRLLTEKLYLHTRSAAQELILGFCDPKKGDFLRSIWGHLLRIDYRNWVAGDDGPLALVVPDGTATNYRCRRRWNPVQWNTLTRVRSVRIQRLEDYHKLSEDVQSTLRHLWYFYAQAEREDRYESILSSLVGTGSTNWTWMWFSES